MNARKKIAVNTRFLIKNKLEGIGLFTAETLQHITRSHPEIDFYFLFDRKYDEQFIYGTNVHPVVLFPQARHPFLWYWWFEISVSGWLKQNRPALFLSPDGYACLNTVVPQVMVIHDLAFEHFKGYVGLLADKYYRCYTPRFAYKATRLATVSEFSKSDIVKQYGIDPGKIDVVYNGAKDIYTKCDEATREQTKRQYANGQDYFIYVGSIHPRKNVANLLRGFEKFKSDSGGNMKLLLAGRKGWDFREVDETLAAMKYREDVNFLGHVPPDELSAIVGSACAMVYVSLFEGFGIPIVEAMRAGVPVITSNISSMPEVAGDAALLCNPYSIDSISAAMVKLVTEPGVREMLITKGEARAKKFTWQATAEKLWDCCMKVL